MNIREKIEALPVRREPSGIDWLLRSDVLAILGEKTPKCEHGPHRTQGSMPKCRHCGKSLDQRRQERRGEG